MRSLLFSKALPASSMAALLLLAGCAADADGDGVPDDTDCAPEDPNNFPGNTEDPTDGQDNDCDGFTDEDDGTGDDDDTPPDRIDPGELDVEDTVLGDFSCVGEERGELAEGPLGLVEGFIEDFQDEFGVPLAYIQIWPENNPSETAASWEGRSDENGDVVIPDTVLRSCKPFAARVWTEFDPPESYQSYQINFVLAGSPPYSETFTSVSYSTYNLVALTLGLEVQKGLGIAAGRLKDCTGEPIGNAEVSVGTIDWASGNITDAPGYNTRYFNDEEDPDVEQMHVATSGLYGAINVSPENEPWDVFAWAIPQDEAHCMRAGDDSIIRPEGNAALCLIGTTRIIVLPNSVNIANIELKAVPDSCFPTR